MSTFEIIMRILQVLIAAFWIAMFVMSILTKREERENERRGYWVEHLDPRQLRGEPDDFAIIYHERGKWRFFYGKIGGANVPTVFIPNENEWREQMPEWLRERRAVIRERLQAEAPPFVTIMDAPPPP